MGQCCRKFNAGVERFFGKYELLQYPIMPAKKDSRGVIKAIWKNRGVTGRKVVLYVDGSVYVNDREFIKYPESLSFVSNDQRSDAFAKDYPERYDYIYQSGFQPFLFWNFVAAFFHLLNAVASFFGAQENQRTNAYPMYQGFTGWTPEKRFCKAANFTCPSAGDVIKCISTDGYVRGRVDEDMMMAIQPSLTKPRYTVSLFWLIISFHFLSAIFQFIAGACFKNFYARHVLSNGVNSFRFIEYSMSATLMLLCIALIGSLQDVYAHIGLGVLCTATMLFGLIAEVLFSDEFLNESLKKEQTLNSDANELGEEQTVALFRRPRFNNELGDIYKENLKGDGLEPLLKLVRTPGDDCSGVEEKVRQLGWFVHVCGWITMAGAYGGILINHYFWSTEQAKAEYDDFEGPPEWITALIFTIAALYNIFGFTQLFQLCAKDPYCYSFQTGRGCCRAETKYSRKAKAGRIGRCCFGLVSTNYSGDGKRIKCNCCGEMLNLNEGVELFYVINSLVTKTILGWVIISQLLVLDFKVEETINCEP